jgi:hypothetical protein
LLFWTVAVLQLQHSQAGNRALLCFVWELVAMFAPVRCTEAVCPCPHKECGRKLAILSLPEGKVLHSVLLVDADSGPPEAYLL